MQRSRIRQASRKNYQLLQTKDSDSLADQAAIKWLYLSLASEVQKTKTQDWNSRMVFVHLGGGGEVRNLRCLKTSWQIYEGPSTSDWLSQEVLKKWLDHILQFLLSTNITLRSS